MDYLKNLYYDEFAVFFQEHKGRLGFSNVQDVQKELDKWIQTKELKKEIINQNQES